LPALKDKQIDLIISAFNFTPEREKTLAISQIYHNTDQMVWLYAKQSDLTKAFTLEGKTVGVQTGTIFENWAHENEKSAYFTVKSFFTTPLLVEKLKSREVDIAVVEENQAKQYCAQEPTLAFQRSGIPAGGYVVAMRKGSPLLAQVDASIEKLKAEGFFAKNDQKWLSA
jgi:arginine/lysine/histidine transporter system substrate-binding protein